MVRQAESNKSIFQRVCSVNRSFYNLFSALRRFDFLNKKLLLCGWVAVISIAQLFIDKVVFPEGEKFQRRESELYQPMSELQYKQQQVIRVIRERNYFNQLDTAQGERTIDQNYINTLLDFHREIVNLYEITTSKTLLFAISEMATDVGKMTEGMNAICVDESHREEFFKATTGFIPLTQKMIDTRFKILDFDARVRSAKPDRDEKGVMVVEAASDHIKLILEMMQEPDLLVRFKDTENPLHDIDKFVQYYNIIHLGYGECTQAYAAKVESYEDHKLFWQVVVFLLLTFVMYRKDLL